VEQSSYGLRYVRLYYPRNVPSNEEIYDKIQYRWCPDQNSIQDQRYKQEGRTSVQRPLNESDSRRRMIREYNKLEMTQKETAVT